MKIYVDDLNQAGFCLPLGSVYHHGKLFIPGKGWCGRSHKGKALSQEQKTQIELEGQAKNLEMSSQTERERWSAAIYREVAIECLPRSVRMKEDTPGNHPDRMLPILDTKMAVVGGQIVHPHYSKPMPISRDQLCQQQLSITFLYRKDPEG